MVIQSAISGTVGGLVAILINYLFIRGVKTVRKNFSKKKTNLIISYSQRNHRLILPLLILVGIFTGLMGLALLFSLITINPILILLVALCFGFVFYFFLCYYTVYSNIQEERFTNVQFSSVQKA